MNNSDDTAKMLASYTAATASISLATGWTFGWALDAQPWGAVIIAVVASVWAIRVRIRWERNKK